MTRGVSCLAPWFGSNRLLASRVGEALDGCSWVGVVFAGGMSELPHITARTILVNDLHRHVINLARVVADDTLRKSLVRNLRRAAFHPDELKRCQEFCQLEPGADADLALAKAYFVCCWMGRSGKSGIGDEFNGRPSVRWKSDGGDSRVRFDSAIRGIASFSRTLRRCTFETMDAFDFLERCEDLDGHAVYADPPFPGVGMRYRHNPGDDETGWHRKLAASLARFERCRVVCRFYENPLIRELYPEPAWRWLPLDGGKKQSNEKAPEVLVIRNGKRNLF